MTDTPIVSYDDIAAHFAKEGIKITDICRSSLHFGEWHRKHALPTLDSDGRDIGSSHIFMTMYREAPDGQCRKPPYVNFWHWLIDGYEHIAWNETARGRNKLVPVERGMHQPRSPLSEDQMEAAIARAIGHIPLPDHVRDGVHAQLRGEFGEQVVRHNECLKIVDRILDMHGDSILIRMTV